MFASRSCTDEPHVPDLPRGCFRSSPWRGVSPGLRPSLDNSTNLGVCGGSGHTHTPTHLIHVVHHPTLCPPAKLRSISDILLPNVPALQLSPRPSSSSNIRPISNLGICTDCFRPPLCFSRKATASSEPGKLPQTPPSHSRFPFPALICCCSDYYYFLPIPKINVCGVGICLHGWMCSCCSLTNNPNCALVVLKGKSGRKFARSGEENKRQPRFVHSTVFKEKERTEPIRLIISCMFCIGDGLKWLVNNVCFAIMYWWFQ